LFVTFVETSYLNSDFMLCISVKSKLYAARNRDSAMSISVIGFMTPCSGFCFCSATSRRERRLHSSRNTGPVWLFRYVYRCDVCSQQWFRIRANWYEGKLLQTPTNLTNQKFSDARSEVCTSGRKES